MEAIGCQIVTTSRLTSATAPLLAETNPALDLDAYADALVTLFDRAVRKD